MAERTIEIPFVGSVTFPDSMDDAAVTAAAAKLYKEAEAKQKQGNAALRLANTKRSEEERTPAWRRWLNAFDEGATAPGTYLGEGVVRAAKGVRDVARGNVKHGLAEAVRGTGVAALPFAPAAIAAAPAAALGGLVLGVGSEQGAKALGADEDAATLIGAGAGALGGVAGARALPGAIPGANVPIQPRAATAAVLRGGAQLVRHPVETPKRVVAGLLERAATKLDPAKPVVPPVVEPTPESLASIGQAPQTNLGGRLTKPLASRPATPSELPGVELPPSEPSITPGGRLMGAPRPPVKVDEFGDPIPESTPLGRPFSYTSGQPGPGAVDRPLPVRVGPEGRTPARPPASATVSPENEAFQAELSSRLGPNASTGAVAPEPVVDTGDIERMASFGTERRGPGRVSTADEDALYAASRADRTRMAQNFRQTSPAAQENAAATRPADIKPEDWGDWGGDEAVLPTLRANAEGSHVAVEPPAPSALAPSSVEQTLDMAVNNARESAMRRARATGVPFDEEAFLTKLSTDPAILRILQTRPE